MPHKGAIDAFSYAIHVRGIRSGKAKGDPAVVEVGTKVAKKFSTTIGLNSNQFAISFTLCLDVIGDKSLVSITIPKKRKGLRVSAQFIGKRHKVAETI